MKKHKSKIIVFLLILISNILGMVIGSLFLVDVKRTDDKSILETEVYLDNEMLVARDKQGKKLKPLKYKDTIYLPITEKGYFLGDKFVVYAENKIDINTVEPEKVLRNFEGTTLDGEVYTERELEGYSFTVFFNWSTWCPYCIEDLANIEELNKEYEKENIKVVGLLVDNDIDEAKRLVTEKGITFDIVLPDDILRNTLQTNMHSIPEFRVIDKEGEIVTDNINGEHNILLLENRLDELIIEDCSKCSE